MTLLRARSVNFARFAMPSLISRRSPDIAPVRRSSGYSPLARVRALGVRVVRYAKMPAMPAAPRETPHRSGAQAGMAGWPGPSIHLRAAHWLVGQQVVDRLHRIRSHTARPLCKLRRYGFCLACFARADLQNQAIGWLR